MYDKHCFITHIKIDRGHDAFYLFYKKNIYIIVFIWNLITYSQSYALLVLFIIYTIVIRSDRILNWYISKCRYEINEINIKNLFFSFYHKWKDSIDIALIMTTELSKWQM